ncbi:MAG: hypothetical protein VKN72_25545, partial [Nostocales cyanobacterium 94392]|nr:hypothetical protein [Nostocales cyanobacterium 94392]
NHQFKGNEYQEVSAQHYFQNKIFKPLSTDLGKELVFYSDQKFSLTLTSGSSSQNLQSSTSTDYPLSFIVLRGQDWLNKSIVINNLVDPQKIKMAKSAFPDWMTVDRIKK